MDYMRLSRCVKIIFRYDVFQFTQKGQAKQTNNFQKGQDQKKQFICSSIFLYLQKGITLSQRDSTNEILTCVYVEKDLTKKSQTGETFSKKEKRKICKM